MSGAANAEMKTRNVAIICPPSSRRVGRAKGHKGRIVCENSNRIGSSAPAKVGRTKLCRKVILAFGRANEKGQHARRRLALENWWARLGLNQRPLRCEHSALPLSY